MARLSQELHLDCLECLQHLEQPLVLSRPPVPVPLEAHPKRPLLLEHPLAAALAHKPTSTSRRPNQKAIRQTKPAEDDVRLSSSACPIVISGCSVARCVYQGASGCTFTLQRPFSCVLWELMLSCYHVSLAAHPRKSAAMLRHKLTIPVTKIHVSGP